MSRKSYVSTLAAMSLVAVLFGVLGGVAQTSLMRILPANGFTPALSDTVSGNAGLWWGNGFMGVIGHVATSNAVAGVSTLPALSTCGTSPTMTGGSSDFAGQINTGSGATSCTLSFAAAFTQAPFCSVDAQGTATQATFTVSATQIVMSVAAASTSYNYICVARASG